MAFAIKGEKKFQMQIGISIQKSQCLFCPMFISAFNDHLHSPQNTTSFQEQHMRGEEFFDATNKLKHFIF